MKEELFCVTPFVNFVGRPSGDINLCCLLPDHVIGNINKKNLLEIWNSDKAKMLRREFLTGKVETCHSNILARGCNRWDDSLKEHVELNETQSKPPIKIDLRLNGMCNLECIMCDVWAEDNGVYNQDNFWEHAEEKVFPYIKEIKVLGGEPFIQRDFFKLVDRVTSINPECSWSIWTNAAWLFSSFHQRLLDHIDNIKMLTISLDSPVKETFEYIRKKADFSIVMKTV